MNVVNVFIEFDYTELWFYVPLDTKQVFSETFPKPSSSLGMEKEKPNTTRMWANAQRDGRPADYRWRPLLNAAKFG